LPKEQISEKKLINNKKTVMLNYFETDESSKEIKYSHTLYVGQSKKDKTTYYYLINSNSSEAEILEIANSIIKNEKEQ
jgi:hypothetical protein